MRGMHGVAARGVLFAASVWATAAAADDAPRIAQFSTDGVNRVEIGALTTSTSNARHASGSGAVLLDDGTSLPVSVKVTDVVKKHVVVGRRYTITSPPHSAYSVSIRFVAAGTPDAIASGTATVRPTRSKRPIYVVHHLERSVLLSVPQTPEASQLIVVLRDAISGASDPSQLADRLDAAVGAVLSGATSVEDAAAGLDAAFSSAIHEPADLLALDAATRELGGRISTPLDYSVIGTKRSTKSTPLCPSDDPSKNVVVLFVNGVGVTQADFTWDKVYLGRLVASALPNALTGGIYQTSATDPEVSFFGGRVCPAVSRPFMLLRAAIEKACRNGGGFALDLLQAGEQALDPFARYGFASIAGLGQAPEIASEIQQLVLSGKTVLLVPHSQGNFFVRDALALLDQPSLGTLNPVNSVGVIMTGSPLESSAISRFVGAERTRVVQVAQDFVARIGNLTCGPECSASTLTTANPIEYHSFLDSYLAGAPAAAIAQALKDLAAGISNPYGSAGIGDVQITLRWDTATDVDLHVTEPDGTQVYFANKRGTTGSLDVDNTSGFGPENYYICSRSSVATGSYQIGVDYYRGYPTTNVQVIVKAGSLIKAFTTTLFTADYGSSVQPLATIRFDGLTFSIE